MAPSPASSCSWNSSATASSWVSAGRYSPIQAIVPGCSRSRLAVSATVGGLSTRRPSRYSAAATTLCSPGGAPRVGRGPDGGAAGQAPPLRLRAPLQPDERPPGLLQGPRVAAAVCPLQGGGGD